MTARGTGCEIWTLLTRGDKHRSRRRKAHAELNAAWDLLDSPYIFDIVYVYSIAKSNNSSMLRLTVASYQA